MAQKIGIASATKGFKYNAAATSPHYTYDLNGNLTLDKHKDLFFNYNHLNLPNSINNSADSYITLTYTADGEKLTKVASGQTRNYVAGIEYLGANLEAVYHAEGRCTPNGATAFHYEYTIKDHLGNARVNFRANGTAVLFIEDMHYYPFGMQMDGMGTQNPTNKYLYNGKERNEDLGLNWYDYGARWYDAALGRWWSVDPLASGTVSISTYAYVLNNPMVLVDPNGMAGVAADGLTNEQWIESSRPGDRNKPDEYKKENRRKEIGEIRHKKSTALNAYVTNTLSESELSVAQLVQALNYVADIYSKNGLSEVFNFQFLSKNEARSLSPSNHELFIGILGSETRRPGKSHIAVNGSVTPYVNGNLETYANMYWAKKYSTKDPIFALGYLISHELLHQLNQQSTYYLEGATAAQKLAGSDASSHDDSVLNLNMQGPEIVRRKQFPQGPSAHLRQAETILEYQRSKILLYLFENNLNK